MSYQLAKKRYAWLWIDFSGSGDSKQPFVENNFDDSVSNGLQDVNFSSHYPGIDKKWFWCKNLKMLEKDILNLAILVLILKKVCDQ